MLFELASADLGVVDEMWLANCLLDPGKLDLDDALVVMMAGECLCRWIDKPFDELSDGRPFVRISDVAAIGQFVGAL